MSNLCVIVLTLNESENIGACVRSALAQDLDVIVVDSGSTDETERLASEAGAEVCRNVPSGDFRITDQRNWALEHVKGRWSWAMFLDADERVTRSFANSLLAETEGSSHDVFYAAPKFIYQGTWLRRFSGFPNWHPRVAKTSLVRPFVGGVWEEFDRYLRAGHIAEPYLHYANSKGYVDWFGRHLRYARWDVENEAMGIAVSRKARLRKVRDAFGPIQPFVVVFYHLVIRRGILDGGSVFSYAMRTLAYQIFLREGRREYNRSAKGLAR